MTSRQTPGPSQPAGIADSRAGASQFDAVLSGVEQELADLRYLWGGKYRITWRHGFRATDIATGEAIEAQTSPELRKLIIFAESGEAQTPGSSE